MLAMSRLAFPGKLVAQVPAATNYMSEIQIIPDSPQTGACTPEELALHHAGVISAQRDRSELEVAFVHAVRSVLDATSAQLFRVFTPKGDCLAGLVAKSDHSGQHCLDDGLSWPANTASIEHFPALHRSLTSGNSIVVPAASGGLHEQVFPIVREGNVFFGFIVVRQPEPLSDLQQRMVGGLVRLFRNQLRLLDYSEIDTLTGLLNRKTFDESLLRILSSLQHSDVVANGNVLHLPRRRQSGDADHSHWLAVIDIDHFKSINDTYGHLIGDEVLLMIANMMKTSFRAHDKLFRFGGEEFVVILNADSGDFAAAGFDRFRASVESHEFPQVGQVTCSVGFTTVSRRDVPTDVVGRADEALYFAKRNGRNRVYCYENLLADGAIAVSRVTDASVSDPDIDALFN